MAVVERGPARQHEVVVAVEEGEGFCAREAACLGKGWFEGGVGVGVGWREVAVDGVGGEQGGEDRRGEGVLVDDEAQL